METFTTKFHRVCSFLILGLICSLIVTAQNVPECCRQRTCSCRIYDLLHGSGNHAAGILTLGKRKTTSLDLHSRLYRLLHGSGNHAAGILTMGKRSELGTDQVPVNPGGADLCARSLFPPTQPTPPGCGATSHRMCQDQLLKDCRKELTVQSN